MTAVSFGPFLLDLAQGTLLRDGRSVPVNQKGIRLLASLLRAPGVAVDKRTLMDAAWPETAVEESNLSVQMAALRKLLGTGDDGGEWIATVPRAGYRFTGSVVSVNGHADELSQTRPLISVLPFSIISEVPGKEYLANGITYDIITALTRYRWFRVIAFAPSHVFGETISHDARAPKGLGTRYALKGSVRSSAQRLRISALLIDTNDGAHLWAERYDVAMVDVFAIQDEIAERVVAAIEPELLKRESRLALARHTGNITAWDLVRQGMWHFHKVTREGHQTARELFRRACLIDSELPEAHTWLARVSAGLIAYAWSGDPITDGREGMGAAIRAVALDPRDPYSHYAFAIVNCYAGSPGVAALAAQSAVDLNPSFALGHLVLGMARLFEGDAQRAMVSLEHGLALNPNDPQNVTWQIILSYAQLLANQPDRALASAKRALSIRPVFRPTFEALACAAVALGLLDAAREWAFRMCELDGPECNFIKPMRAYNPAYETYIKSLHNKLEAPTR